MRELVAQYLSNAISRRTFLKRMTAAGVSTVAARSVLESLVPAAHAAGPPSCFHSPFRCCRLC